MKKLGKLSISPEKIMKNEELINLQGGYQGWCCFCDGISILAGPSSMEECQDQCDLVYDVIGWWSYQLIKINLWEEVFPQVYSPILLNKIQI